MDNETSMRNLLHALAERIDSIPTRYAKEPVVRHALERINKLREDQGFISMVKVVVETGYILGYVQCLRDKE